MFTCGYCGEDFEGSTHPNAKNKYCSENCRKRKWEATHPHQHKCACCGGQVSRQARQCWDCTLDGRDADRIKRWEAITELWNAGVPMKEMVKDPRVTRSTVSALGVEMDRMNKAGWDLKPRRKGWNGCQQHRGGPPKKLRAVYSPQEAAARVGDAVRAGRLTRSSSCNWCGREGRVEGHHHDYAKPLEVTWICRSCHATHHANERSASTPQPIEVAA